MTAMKFDENGFLTPEDLEKYKDQSGSVCPFCGKTDTLEWKSPEWTDGGTYGEVSCNDCGALWGEGHVTIEVIDLNGKD